MSFVLKCHVEDYKLKFYLMLITTNMAELLVTGTFFITEYDQTKISIIQFGGTFLILRYNPVSGWGKSQS